MIDCMLRAGRDWGKDVVGDVQSRLFGEFVEVAGRLVGVSGIAMIIDQ
jgi:class 3 adenylate cyclase